MSMFPISHTTTEVLPSGSTITTIHLTEEGRRGLTCDAEAFKRAADASIAYYKREAKCEMRKLTLFTITGVLACIGCITLAIMSGLGWITLFWAVVFLDIGLSTIRDATELLKSIKRERE